MSLVGSCPCCWPLAGTSLACGSEGFCCMVLDPRVPLGKEVGITATSMSELEWAGWVVVGDMGKRGWGLKVLDNEASVLMAMSLKASVLPSLAFLSPGHAVLCGVKKQTSGGLQEQDTSLPCGVSTHCTIPCFPPPTEMSPRKERSLLSLSSLPHLPHLLVTLSCLSLYFPPLLACMNHPFSCSNLDCLNLVGNKSWR